MSDWDKKDYAGMLEFVAPKEKRQERIDICGSCEFLNKLYFCKICKCFMPAKTWLPDAVCPMSKWGAVEEENNKKET